jgi:penicillin-binding protein A
MSKRIRRLGVAMIVMFAGLLIQLDNIQGLKASQYQKSANNPVVIENEFSEPRGRIVSSDGVVLATSVPAPPNATYAFERQYPTGSLFAQIVGFTSYRYGTYTGVEAEYKNLLAYHTQPVNNLGELFDTEEGTDTVVLTVSDKLQALARQALGSKDGAVVALNPSNGDVLAMYSNPSFDPNPLASPSLQEEGAGWNAYKAKDSEGFTNGVPLTYGDTFAPGSTFKVITSAAVFDHDPQFTTQSFPYRLTYTPPGTNLPIHNDSGVACGGTIQVMLPASCDTGYAQLGVDLGAPNLVTEASSFGFFARPPIDLPTSPFSFSDMCSNGVGEKACEINLQGNQPFLAYSAIGQGNVQATPLEMALVASGIANDGVIMKPHVMDDIYDPNDKPVETYNPTPWIRATSASTARAVTSLMEAVVTSGTAKDIFPASWDVAAKTGTAQAGQGNTATNDWMVAFAPANHPRIAIAVVVPHQTLTATGASVSGPIVRTVLKGFFGGAS